MKKSKLERVLESLVNDETGRAQDLLREHIVEAARVIYADLAEEDELDEAGVDLDESMSDTEFGDDFEDDIDSIKGEIETEEHFGESEEDEALSDLDGEMDTDLELDGEFSDLEGEADVDAEFGPEEELDGETDVEDAMTNVEDALDELRAAFADIMGDETEVADDEVSDEFGGELDADGETDEDGEFEFGSEDDLEESVSLKQQSVTMSGDDDSKGSPVLQNNNKGVDANHANPVDFAGGADEKGGNGDSAKQMNVTDPQAQGGKMNKKVSKPSNSSEKSKSSIGS